MLYPSFWWSLTSLSFFSSEVEQILLDITSDIPNWFNFLFEPTHVEVISGKTEGMYAWISLNYMLGRFSLDPRPG